MVFLGQEDSNSSNVTFDQVFMLKISPMDKFGFSSEGEKQVRKMVQTEVTLSLGLLSTNSGSNSKEVEETSTEESDQ